MPPSSGSHERPTLVAGRYALGPELGRGGAGRVYRATDVQLRRPVAIKVLDATSSDPIGVERFRREAQAVARLQHPGIVALLDAGTHEGRPFIVFELVAGESLETLLQRTKLSPKQIAEIVRDLARAVAHAHGRSVLHRDLKPENVLVDGSWRARVTDFGLARGPGGGAITTAGEVVGTPGYMAPEQADAARADQGPWTDVYALGAILYRALAGRPPFVAASLPEALKKVLFDEPVPLRSIDADVHEDLETIALRALAKEPARRYVSADDFADELDRFLDGKPIRSRPVGFVERWGRAARINRAAALLALLALAGVFGVGSLAIEGRRREARRAQAALIEDARQRAGDGKLDEAIALCTRAFELVPGDRAALVERMRCRQIRGDFAGALADARACFALGGEDDDTVVETYAQLLVDGDDPNAAAELERLRARHPGDAVVAFERCQRLVLKGKLEEVRAELERFAAQPTDRDAVLFFRAIARLELDQDALALEDLKRLPPRLFPDQPRLVGEVKLKLGDTTGALESLDEAIRRRPTSSDAWADRALVHERRGERDAALADARQALAIDPRQPLATAVVERARGHALEVDVLARARARAEAHDIEGALAIVSSALENEPRRAGLWNTRGLFRILKGDLGGAEADLTRALELESGMAAARLNRGRARQLRGDREGARDDYDKLLKDSPGSSEAQVAIGFRAELDAR